MKGRSASYLQIGLSGGDARDAAIQRGSRLRVTRGAQVCSTELIVQNWPRAQTTRLSGCP